VDEITYHKFFSDRIRDFDFEGGCGLFSLTRLVIVDTGPCNCIAHDKMLNIWLLKIRDEG